MKKWKFCFYTVSSYEKVESFLSNMEQEGYRVENRRYQYFFIFTKSKPKKVNYFLTYSPLGSSLSMYDLENNLKGNIGASQAVKEGFEAPGIYRICKTDEDLIPLRRERDFILKKHCINKCVALFLSGVVLETIFIIYKESIINWWMHLLLSLPILISSIYYFIEMCIIKKKMRFVMN